VYNMDPSEDEGLPALESIRPMHQHYDTDRNGSTRSSALLSDRSKAARKSERG
jgi:hypothetical protein